MKIFQKIISVIAVACVLASVSLTAFASNLYEQVQYLSEDELFDEMWNAVVEANGTEQEKATGNTFMLSYTYQDLKEFLQDYQIPDGDFKVSDLRDIYFDKLFNSDTVIQPYSEKVVEYIAHNPNAELSWNFDNSTQKYVCYDRSTLVDTFSSDEYVMYSKQNIDKKTFWTYDEAKDKYVGKDSNGTLVKSIPKYHLDDEASLPQTSTSSNTSDISRNIDNDSNSHNTTPARQNSITDTVSIVEDTQVSEEIVYESAEESSLSQSQSNEMVAEETYIDDTSGNQTSRDRKTIVSGVIDEETAMETFVPDIAEKESNNFVQVVLIIIGILVIIGIVIIIVMLKRKSANKNEE